MNALAYASPEPCQLGKKAIGELAENLARHTQYEIGSDLQSLVERLGGQMRYQDIWELESSESGSIEVRGDKDFVITIAAHTSRARDRFTIAHELGHYFLHYRLPKLKGKDSGPLRAARYGGDQAEVEANWFAASFLMPEGPFKEAFQATRGDLVALASQFGVSTSAASVRAKSLGL
ncbi:ImmA/IrrE family metallo-endopeptidase [Burkholderia gladioli]|uniref:ImmA/IrrE family metallo-endopeptidase n=1 Tax=Burkholderia gladioli TaxID=28095 RepID=UPI001643507F|nr:ImmA/IrrE family metallo-endopeptidase [Burkholderia gladioli]